VPLHTVYCTFVGPLVGLHPTRAVHAGYVAAHLTVVTVVLFTLFIIAFLWGPQFLYPLRACLGLPSTWDSCLIICCSLPYVIDSILLVLKLGCWLVLAAACCPTPLRVGCRYITTTSAPQFHTTFCMHGCTRAVTPPQRLHTVYIHCGLYTFTPGLPHLPPAIGSLLVATLVNALPVIRLRWFVLVLGYARKTTRLIYVLPRFCYRLRLPVPRGLLRAVVWTRACTRLRLRLCRIRPVYAHPVGSLHRLLPHALPPHPLAPHLRL